MIHPAQSAGEPLYDRARLRGLVADLCEGDISPVDHAELQEILRASEEARAQFLEQMCVHAGLEWEIAARGKLAALIDSCQGGGFDREPLGILTSPTLGESPPRKLRPILFLAAAASLLVAAAVYWLPSLRQSLSGSRRGDGVVQNSDLPSKIINAPPVVAAIAPATDDCRWLFEKESLYEKESDGGRTEVHSGDTLRVLGGTLTLTYTHGSEVTLKAPAILEVVTSMRGRLIRGRATVTVALGAEGFTIDTPGTSVVDLGTVFGIEVDDFGRTDVAVFRGMVDVAYSRDVEGSTGGEVGKQRLSMGEAVRVDEWGTMSRIISLVSDRFAADGVDSRLSPSRETVISSVRDNIKREDAWNFYEIVPGGMREDAKAFVDRLHHEWNGVDERGIPAYLVGGDYVKTFNDDKRTDDLEVSVTLDQPATLYVLWCQRISPPAWLREEFQDTHDTIGVDEGYHVFDDGTVHDKGQPGVGPGESVDSVHTVWRRLVTKPGVVQLGPTESLGWDLNMYGIVAVPLPRSDR